MEFSDRLMRYNGADWAGMFLIGFSIYFVGKRRRIGFVFGFFGCLAWLAFGVMTGSVASMLANTAYAIMNIHGYMRWTAQTC